MDNDTSFQFSRSGFGGGGYNDGHDSHNWLLGLLAAHCFGRNRDCDQSDKFDEVRHSFKLDRIAESIADNRKEQQEASSSTREYLGKAIADSKEAFHDKLDKVDTRLDFEFRSIAKNFCDLEGKVRDVKDEVKETRCTLVEKFLQNEIDRLRHRHDDMRDRCQDLSLKNSILTSQANIQVGTGNVGANTGGPNAVI